MLGKMKPKAFTAEQLNAIKVEATTQTTDFKVQKSADPENHPVFEIPVNTKVLVYVPNHTVINEDGVEELRMDKPLIHTVMNGKRYDKIRCTRGLSEATGYSGECPLCNGTDEPWALANEQIKEQCKIRGLDPNDTNSESVKAVKREYYSKRVIKAPEQVYTFPIVVIETDPNDIKKIIFDEEGKPVHKAYWYSISKTAYEKKWAKTLEGMEDEPTHPGGNFFILNYTYESRSGEYNKRDSARELQVVAKRIKNSNILAEQYDKETVDWDVAKAIETIFDNMYYEEADIQAEADKILASTREKIAIYESAILAPQENSGFNLQPQGNGGALPAGDDEEDNNAFPMAGQTDEE
ncbi:hypothetical protein ACEE21_15090 [Clostridium baratii]